MNNKKVLILDCDGVLYPTEQLPLRNIVQAMKTTYRQDMHVDGELQSRISAETIRDKKLGLFNYVKAMCEAKSYNFDQFCQQMTDRIDYSHITKDEILGQKIMQVAKQDRVVVLTNNHHDHLQHVFQARFGKSLDEFQQAGVETFDITTTEKNGVFRPKSDPEALHSFAGTLGQNPENCILLDDTSANIDSARKIGMHAVWIHENDTLKNYLSENYPIPRNERTGHENG